MNIKKSCLKRAHSGWTHQGACSCTKPSHKPQAAVPLKVKPAKRVPQLDHRDVMDCPACSLFQTKGMTVNTKPPPKANMSITKAPCTGLALKSATIKAEYSSPQGNKAQAMPNKSGP
jgi:hypothetical protein